MAKKRGKSAEFLRNLRRKHGLGEFRKSNKSYSTTRGQSKGMAKKRRSKGKKSFMSSISSPLGILVGGAAYGAIRSYASDKLSPITSKIPLGNLSDEVVLFGISYLVRKKVNNKIVKDVALAGMAVEAARIGETIRDGNVFNVSSSSASSGTALG